MKREYQICKRCIMDTSDKTIVFDEDGICNHCKGAIYLNAKRGYKKDISEQHLKDMLTRIKKEQECKKYDCIIGVSGGGG